MNWLGREVLGQTDAVPQSRQGRAFVGFANGEELEKASVC